MPRPLLKTEVLSCRVTSEVKTTLVRSAKQERRSLAGMLEVMILEWQERQAGKPKSPRAKK